MVCLCRWAYLYNTSETIQTTAIYNVHATSTCNNNKIWTYGERSTTEPWEEMDLRGIGRNMFLLVAPISAWSLNDMELECCCVSIPSTELGLGCEGSSSATTERDWEEFCSTESSRAVGGKKWCYLFCIQHAEVYHAQQGLRNYKLTSIQHAQ